MTTRTGRPRLSAISEDRTVASASDVDEYIAHARAAFLECRDYGTHAWRKHWASTASRRRNYHERHFRCTRCGTILEQQVSPTTGAILRRRMKYPDGYLAKNTGRIVGEARDHLRLASFDRPVVRPRLRRVG